MNSSNQWVAQTGGRENWLPTLELSAREVFEIMLATKLMTPTDTNASPNFEFTAMVGLAGQLCGVLTVRCSSDSAALMASKMLGIRPDEANQQMWDAIGEICNMIAGNFKNKLAGMGDHCMLSVPTVITGEDYNFHSLADGGSLGVTLLFEGAPVLIALELHS